MRNLVSFLLQLERKKTSEQQQKEAASALMFGSDLNSSFSLRPSQCDLYDKCDEIYMTICVLLTPGEPSKYRSIETFSDSSIEVRHRTSSSLVPPGEPTDEQLVQRRTEAEDMGDASLAGDTKHGMNPCSLQHASLLKIYHIPYGKTSLS
jgi:hypothetical protein